MRLTLTHAAGVSQKGLPVLQPACLLAAARRLHIHHSYASALSNRPKLCIMNSQPG